MSDWRKSPVVAVAAMSLFLVLQLAIPISRLEDETQAQRFAWQMFSRFHPEVEFTVNTEADSYFVDLDQVMARQRADLSLGNSIPAHLCDLDANAVSIVWESESYQC